MYTVSLVEVHNQTYLRCASNVICVGRLWKRTGRFIARGPLNIRRVPKADSDKKNIVLYTSVDSLDIIAAGFCDPFATLLAFFLGLHPRATWIR